MALYLVQLMLVCLVQMLQQETVAQTISPTIPITAPLRLNVCGACSTNPHCCDGWTRGPNDGQSCLTPTCGIACGEHGVCTSPNTCTCYPGFVGQHCNTESQFQYDVNLLHGKTPHQGLLQVRGQYGEWQFVHPDNWSRNNSHVACQQLGYHFSTFYSELSLPAIPEASSQFLLQQFNCVGDEDSLQDCDIMELAEEPEHMQIVAIECYDSSQYETLTGLKDKCGSPCDQEIFSRIGCKCDPLCESYGDCCPDYFTNSNSCTSGQAVQVDEACVPINAVTLRHISILRSSKGSRYFDLGYFYIDTCSTSWFWNDEISRLCSNDPSATDPITFIPVHERNVSNPPIRKIYKNVFCSVCNFRDIKEVQPWNIIYYETEHTSSVRTIHDMLPPSQETAPRTCLLNMKSVKTCLYYHKSISKMCDEYYVPWHVSSEAFSSVFCAVCSGKYPQYMDVSVFETRLSIPSIEPAKCDGLAKPQPPQRTRPRPQPRPTLANLHDLFNFNNQENECDETELYDFFSQKCRLLTCPQDFMLSNGTCQKIPFVLLTDNTEGYQTVNMVTECAFNALNREFETVNETIPIHANNVTGNTQRLVVDVESDSFMPSSISLNNILEVNKSKAEKICNVSSFLVLSDEYSDNEDRENISCIHRDEIPGCVSRNAFDQDLIMFTNKTVLLYEFFWKQGAKCYGIRMTWVDCNHGAQPPTLCAEIKLALEEFDMHISANNTTTIMHKSSGKILANDEFRFEDNETVHVCSSLLFDADTRPNGEINALSYVTFACFVLSLVATFMTLISYCVFKELRNVTGYVVMNLLVAFFVAQLVFLLSPHLLQPPELCLTSAVIGHFSWLSGFFWMNALSFVTTSTLSRNTLVRDKTMEMCRLIRYMVYAWGSPFLIVSVCITIQFCGCTEIAPIYGQKGSALCWLIGHDGYANLWGFIAPVFALLFCNVVLFIYAVVSFRLKSAKSRTTSKKLKVELSVYIKLTILMGLPWLLGYVLTFIANIYLEYIYTVINSLQGVFIFWTLVLTGRAGKLWRGRIRRSRGSLGGIGRSFRHKGTSDKITTSTFSMSSTRAKEELPSDGFNSSSNI